MIIPNHFINESIILCGELEVGSLNEANTDGIISNRNPSEDFKNHVMKALKFSSFYVKKEAGIEAAKNIDEHVCSVESAKAEDQYALILPHSVSTRTLSETCEKIFIAGGFKKGNPINKTNENYYYKLSPDKVNIYVANGTITGVGENSNIVLKFRCCENKKEITDIVETGDITVSAAQKRLNGKTMINATDIYGENVAPDHIDYSSIERSTLFNKIVNEHFNLSHRPTRQHLISLDEAGQNAVITNLTSKLYDKIVKKCEDIDYGEIPNTKGDITKLSKYEDMKETIVILHDLLKEYKQDSGPVDELSVAFSNIETRKDLFEKAYRYNSELPMVMYCNVVLGIITGISYMIATCVEFIKDPGTNTFQIALDRNSYRRTKDHTIYNTLRQFNKACSKGDFDKAMNAVMTSQARNFAGAAVIGGVAVGTAATILILIPILRELIFMFYYARMRVSDFFDIQADLLTMNAYSIEANNEFTKQEKKEIIDRQLKFINAFRKIANVISFEVKKAEVEADKEKKSDDESKELIDDIGGVDTGSNGSALF